MRMQNILLLGGLVALGVYLGGPGRGGALGRGTRRALAYRPGLPGASDRDYGQIRPAGRDQTRDDRGRWDRVDEASDASFPASDPPSTY